MRSVDRFAQRSTKLYNGQDVLKNHFLERYPVLYTDDPKNYEQITQYAGQHEFVWIVDKNIQVPRSFPWHFRPQQKHKQFVHLFPYVYKKSQRPKDWNKVQLVPTNYNSKKTITHSHVCGVYDVYQGKDQFDIFYVGNSNSAEYQKLIKKFPNIIAVHSHAEARTLSTTDMFWLVPDDVKVKNTFKFNYEPDEWSFGYTHVFGNGNSDTQDGIALFPKDYIPTDKELSHRFYSNKKSVRIVASVPLLYEKFKLSSYEEYINALSNSKTEMFWYIPMDVKLENSFKFDLYFSHQNQYDRNINHVFLNDTVYDGIVLFSKNSIISKNEFNTRFIIHKKQHDIVASIPTAYDIFYIDSYEDYLTAKNNTKTEMFWGIPSDITVKNNLDLYFDYHNRYDRNITHVFLNNKTYDGIALHSKNISLLEKEIQSRFYVNKKEHSTVYSTPTSFEQFEIDTYEEYLTALETSKTEMFWMTSKNVQVNQNLLNEFYIDHHNVIDRKQNHAFVHQVGDQQLYNGVFLCSKYQPLTEREIEHRHLVNRKEWDIVASGPVEYDVFNIDSYDEYLTALETSKTEMFWMTSRNITATIPDVYFDHYNDYDRKQNHAFVHQVGNQSLYNGVFLCSVHTPLTKREIEHRHPVNRKEWDTVASGPVEYDVFNIDSYDEYLTALETSKTEMFWMTSRNLTATIPDVYFDHYNNYDRNQNHAFVHQVDDHQLYNGVFLCSVHTPLTKREIEHRHLVNKKEWDIVASGPVEYDVFKIDSYEEYLTALNNSKTEMFWMTSRNLTTDLPDVYFDHSNTYDRNQNHAFVHQVGNQSLYNGVFLCSVHKSLTEQEVNHRHPVDRKQWDTVASGPVEYDVFEIDSYEQYLTASNASKTEMFWMTSRNLTATIPDMYFSHDNMHDRKQNHAFVHQVGDQQLYNGVFLCSKYQPLTEREVTHRHPVNRKEWDIVASGPVEYDVFKIDSYDEYLTALETSKTEMFWMTSANLTATIPDVYFDHYNDYDRKQNHAFVHQVGDQQLYNGVFLCSIYKPLTEREITHRHLVNRKEWDTVASGPVEYDVFKIDSYAEYLTALETSKTEMFWSVPGDVEIDKKFKFDLYFDHSNEYDRKTNHVMLNASHRDGIVLFSKHSPVSKKEVETRFYINKKEWNIVASNPSPYDQFVIDNYDDYEFACRTSKTEMFWMIPPEVTVADNFKFDLYFDHHNRYDLGINHVFKNGKAYDGISLLSTKSAISKKEISMRFFTDKKTYETVASNPLPYDIVFISKDEAFANENFNTLTTRFPNAKRISNVVGIHQAHIAAAKLCNTDMFWVVDGDAEIIDNFHFDYYVPRYDPDSKKTVHVWKAMNPINNLIYGYGAVKLLPTQLTLEMDITKPDMTTSISPLFKSINRVSNITKFNTDEFSTWRSAFRECVKLSSKTINGQLDEETEFRLNAWCTRGNDKLFGDYCIAGAKAGKLYGEANAADTEKLSMINDFVWLEQQFKKSF